MFKLNQKGAAHLLLIILLLAGLGVAVYLVGQTTNIIPKAYMPKAPLSAPVTPSPSPTPSIFTCNACAADIVKSARNRVDAQDNAVLSSCFGKSPSTTLPGGKSCTPADINKDGSINQTDVDCLRSVYFQTCTATPSPSATPDTAAKRVFVTSADYNGNLGGLSGADTKCQARADATTLGGTWKAWLSDSTVSAASRLIHNTGPYKLLDGTVVANNWDDLTDGTLLAGIQVTELKTKKPDFVWTNTGIKGSVKGISHCNNWTSSLGTNDQKELERFGGIGVSSDPNADWTDASYAGATSCDSSAHLYCFEQ